MIRQTKTTLAEKTDSGHTLFFVLLIVLSAGIYFQTLSFHFLTNWDDPIYVTQNSSIQKFTLQNLIIQFKTTYTGNYAPLQMISYMFDHALWGMKPGGYHLTNLFFHTLNGLLCYLLVWRLSGSRAAAVIAGSLFIAHPVQVESVTWISQRKNVLSTFFFLASLLSYHRFRTAEKRRSMHYLISLLLFASALLCKAVAVVLPLILLAYELSFNKDKNSCNLRKSTIIIIPFLLLAALAATVAIITQTQANEGGRMAAYHGGSAYATALTMVPVLVRYLTLLVWPANLSALYLPSIKTGIDAEVIAASLLLLALGLFLFYQFRRRPSLLFWFTICIAGLLPVSQVVPLVTIINDRYLYLPMIGIAGSAGIIATCFLEKGSQAKRIVSNIAFIGIVATLAVIAQKRAAVWHDSVQLWLDTLQKIPVSKDILSALAEAHYKSGNTESAISVYQQAFALEGEYTETKQERSSFNTFAVILMSRGEFKQAESFLLQITTKFPYEADGFINLGDCFRMAGSREKAEAAYRRALQLKPAYPPALLAMGGLELEKGNTSNAEKIFKELLAAGVDGPDLRVAMARLNVLGRNPELALDHLEQALRLGLASPSRLVLVPEFSSLAQLPRFSAIIAGSNRSSPSKMAR